MSDRIEDEMRRQVDVHLSNQGYWLKEAEKSEAKSDYTDMHACRDKAENEGWHVARYTRAAAELTALREVNKGLAEALDECAGLFAAIRDDYTDPRSECRAGMNTCAAALNAAKDDK